MSEMTEKDKKHMDLIQLVVGLSAFFYGLCIFFFIPDVAAMKAKKGEFKEACAYVVRTEKEKNHNATIININGTEYKGREILPLDHKAAIKKKEWLKFPLGKDFEDFLKVAPNTCKKVKYVEVYNIFGYSQIYLYSYLDQP